jgi:hypothetical protein
MAPETEIQQLEHLIRVAYGASKRGGRSGALPRDSVDGRDQGTSGSSERRDQLVGLSVDLLVTTRQAGLSPTQSGCLFLLLASHLLDDVPAQALAAMIEEVRGSSNDGRT